VIDSELNPQFEILHNVICAPILHRKDFENTYDGKHSGSFGGGLYTEENVFIPIGVTRYGQECLLNGHPETIAAPTKYIEKAIFGGYLFEEFGHFIIESTARLWVKKYFPDLPFIFIQHKNYANLYTYQIELLSIFGTIEFVNKEPIKVGELILPTCSMVMGESISHDGPSKILRELIKPNIGSEFSGRQIYITRKNINKRKCINEDDFEKELIALGLEIISPENLSIVKQIDLFSNAKLIVGLLGSAWHTLLLGTPQIDCKRIYLDFIDQWGDTYKLIEDVSDGYFLRSKCLFAEGKGDANKAYDIEYKINIDLALTEVKKFLTNNATNHETQIVSRSIEVKSFILNDELVEAAASFEPVNGSIDESEPKFENIKTYIKDFHLEVPDAPNVHLNTFEMEFKNQIYADYELIKNNLFEARIVLKISAEYERKIIYYLELEQAGIFQIINDININLESASFKKCFVFLKPILRYNVADALQRSGFVCAPEIEKFIYNFV